MTGFLNVWKAEGYTSAFVVNKIKRLLRLPCGHMGTLDPLASGVLPVGVGNATRLFDYFLNKTKTYMARFRFGVTSATLDRESELVFGGRIPSEAEIRAALTDFTGELDQVPPAYSAVSVNGKRSYALARRGEEAVLPPKKIYIEKFSLLGQTAPDEYAFEITCGGGTYIRSLARDLAGRLSTNGFMSALVRTRSGVFTRDTAIPLETLTEQNIRDFLLPTDGVLPFARLDCDDKRLYDGLAIPFDGADGMYKLYRAGEFYGLAEAANGYLKTQKKLC